MTRLTLSPPLYPQVLALIGRHPYTDIRTPSELQPNRRGANSSASAGGLDDTQCNDAPQEYCIEFWQGDWHRMLKAGDQEIAGGLSELCDNNPMVCADEWSVPDPASTLALIALGPLIRGGLLVEPPGLLYSFDDVVPEQVDAFLSGAGWEDGANYGIDPQDLGSVLALRAICLVNVGDEVSEIDELYEEAFGRSFFVRYDEDSAWDVSLVAGQPHAVFRLSISEGSPNSLLTVEVMADRDGKCGAAQVVHAMNIMAGFEESVGIAS